jgi:carbamoyl-phosphate synthase small subunit
MSCPVPPKPRSNIIGISVRDQLLPPALGATTYKLERGHCGANQSVNDLATGKVEITSQNHGFAVDAAPLPANAKVTHVWLFNGSNEGIASTDRQRFRYSIIRRRARDRATAMICSSGL